MLKLFQEDNFSVFAGCVMIPKWPYRYCMQWAEEGEKLCKTTGLFVSKKWNNLFFFVKWCFWQSLAFSVCVFVLHLLWLALMNSKILFSEEEKNSKVLMCVFVFHCCMMWKMPSVESIMHTFKVQSTYYVFFVIVLPTVIIGSLKGNWFLSCCLVVEFVIWVLSLVFWKERHQFGKLIVESVSMATLIMLL